MAVPGDSPVPPDRRVRVQGQPVSDYPRLPPEATRGTVRRVTVVGEEVLHRRCQPVTDFGNDELAALIDDMFATMYAAEGVGLAANQVGVDLQLFVYDCADEQGIRHVGHLANPALDELPAAARTLAEGTEGCLSVPGPYRTVSRPDHAVVHGVDQHGQPLVIDGSGYFARCLQHETDHLFGRLYLDRLTAKERRSALREMAEQQEQIFTRRARRAENLHRAANGDA